MNIDYLKQARNLLLRMLFITLIFAMLMQLATSSFWNLWTDMAAQWFHTDKEELGVMLFNFFAAVKFYAIFVLLAPALALHWTVKSQKSSTERS